MVGIGEPPVDAALTGERSCEGGASSDRPSIKSSDFTLKPYMTSSNILAIGQVLSVFVPYAALWYAAHAVHSTMPWLLVPICVGMVLFLCRSFALMHDCGHYSLFSNRSVNRVVGFVFGVVNGLPQYPWSRGHAFHHKYNGNWERYRGPAVVISVERFAQLSRFGQWRYALLRHPLMLLPGGLFYLVAKARVQLLCGLVGLIPHTIGCIWRREWRRIFTFESRFWYTTGEFWDILGNNICVIGLWISCGELMGHGFFWALYAPVMAVSAAIFICVFYIQHNFEDSYAHRDEGWSYLAGALDGSSFFKLPGILNWFTADIGYHNIHHLCARIPNYRLAACHRANAHLLADVHTLRISDIPACAGYILWDAANNRLTTVAAYRQQTQQVPAGSPPAVGRSLPTGN